MQTCPLLFFLSIVHCCYSLVPHAPDENATRLKRELALVSLGSL